MSDELHFQDLTSAIEGIDATRSIPKKKKAKKSSKTKDK